MTDLRTDWTRGEIAALFDLSFADLLFEAQKIHRANHPRNEVQLSTLLSIKTGGCPEDCGYCNQSASADSGLKAEKLMDVDEVLASAREAKRSEEHTSELQSLMRISYAVFCLKKKNIKHTQIK